MLTTEVLAWPPLTGMQTIQKLIPADILKVSGKHRASAECHLQNGHSFKDKRKISLFSCILSSLTTIFAWWKNISLSKEHVDKAEATLHLELFLYGDMHMCVCHCPVAHSRARLLRLHSFREKAVCLRRQGRDPLCSMPAFSPEKRDRHYIHFHLSPELRSKLQFRNEWNTFFPRNKAQVFTLELNPPSH